MKHYFRYVFKTFVEDLCERRAQAIAANNLLLSTQVKIDNQYYFFLNYITYISLIYSSNCN